MFQELGRAIYLTWRYRLVGFPLRKDSKPERKRREEWLIHFENYEAELERMARRQGGLELLL